MRVAVKPHAAFAKHCLGHANPAVRSACVDYLGTLYTGVGASLRLLFSKEKQATVDILEERFSAVSGSALPAPSRFEHGAGDAADGDCGPAMPTAKGGSKSGPARPKTAPVDFGMDRVNLLAAVPKGTLALLGDANWKVRAEGLDNILDTLKKCGPITSDLGDLAGVLNTRLRDHQRNLVSTTLTILAEIATAMGRDITKFIPQFMEDVLSTLAEAKESVRMAGVSVLEGWSNEAGLTPLVESDKLTKALSSGKPKQQTALLTFLANAITEQSGNEVSQYKGLVKGVAACLEDRNKDVRSGAQELFTILVRAVGAEKMSRICNSLNGSTKAAALDLFTKVHDAAPAAPAAASRAETTKRRPATSAGEKSRQTRASSTAKSAKRAPPRESARDKSSGEPAVIADARGRAKRQKDDRSGKSLRWNFTKPRDDFVAQLRDQFKAAANSDMSKLLFSTDFRDHLKAFDVLMEHLEPGADFDAIDSSLDLILKWVTLRFFDTNPKIQLAAMSLLTSLFERMSQEDLGLPDFAASAFLPYLVLQAGKSLDAIRNETHKVFRLVCGTYPSSKLFVFLLEGLKAKNARQRTECLTELGDMIERQGLTVAGALGVAKSTQAIAGQVADRDKMVRNAALDCLVVIFNIIGEDIFKLMGALGDKNESLVAERIKRCGRQVSAAAPTDPKTYKKSPSARPSTASTQRVAADGRAASAAHDTKTYRRRTVDAGVKQEFSLSADLFVQSAHFDGTNLDLAPTEIDFDDESETIKPLERRQRDETMGEGKQDDTPAYIDSIMEMLVSQVPVQAINALKAAEDESNADPDADPSWMTVNVNKILKACTTQARYLFSIHLSSTDEATVASGLRLCKHLLGFVLQVVRSDGAISTTDEIILSTLIADLLEHVMNHKLPVLKEGAQIVKALNCILLKILQTIDLNLGFKILLGILSDNLRQGHHDSKSILFVQRCIWKLVKFMPDQKDSIRPAELITYIAKFLGQHPPVQDAEPDSEDEDVSTRTMRTLCNTLVTCRGDAVKDAVGVLGPNPYYTTTGEMLLASMTKCGIAPPIMSPRSPVTRETLSIAEQEERLVQIFAMITSKEETKQGMEALYHFKQQFPDADTETFLQTTSPFFQNHIKRQLADIHRRQQDKRGRPGTPGGAERTSAKAYMDRLRKLTMKAQKTPVASDGAAVGAPPEEMRSPELPDVNRSGRSPAPPTSPPRVAATQLDSLKARLARIKGHSK